MSDAPKVMGAELRNWTEDFAHENGNYLCKCRTCEEDFLGHKRRVTCRLCAKVAPDLDADIKAGASDTPITASARWCIDCGPDGNGTPRFVVDEATCINLEQQLVTALATINDLKVWKSASDQVLPEETMIELAHPVNSDNHERFQEALRLVGAKRSKYGLLSLVNWLLAERDEARLKSSKPCPYCHKQTGAAYRRDPVHGDAWNCPKCRGDFFGGKPTSFEEAAVALECARNSRAEMFAALAREAALRTTLECHALWCMDKEPPTRLTAEYPTGGKFVAGPNNCREFFQLRKEALATPADNGLLDAVVKMLNQIVDDSPMTWETLRGRLKQVVSTLTGKQP